MTTEHDIVIRNGTVIDGSGRDGFAGEVAISNGVITAVGVVTGRGAEEIDASGRLVTPGFIDIHTHYDGQITWDDRLMPSSNHGVTTVLMGNCGVGFAPCKAGDQARLIKVMEGVEDIPHAVMAEGIPWAWESFADYLDFLETRTADVDFATQVPHAPVRVNVMGERGANREPASDAELAAMRKIVAEAVHAGAFGISTSRSIYHRDASGALAPMVRADERELMALASGLRDAAGGVFQLLPGAQEGLDPDEEMQLFRRIIAASGGQPLSFTLLDSAQYPTHLPRTLNLIAEARAQGAPVLAQVLPRAVGLLFGLDLSFHPFRFKPSYRPIANLPLSERVAAMRDPELRSRLLEETAEHPNEVFLYFASRSDEIYLLGESPNYEPRPEDRMGALAEQQGLSAEEMIYNLMLESDGRAIFMLPSANYAGGNLETVRQMLEHEGTLVGLGDGGAHYGTICDSSYTTFMLTYWTRDRIQGARLALPATVRALSHANACAVGMKDRGLLAAGMIADVNVIDYDRLSLHAPTMRHDLPAGGGRLVQEADGFDATIKSGVVTYRKGKPTGALPGRLVRRGAAT